MPIGSITVAGRNYPVTGLALRKGTLEVTAQGTSPVPAMKDEPVTLYGEDGQGICQAWPVTMPAVKGRKTVTFVLPMRILSVEDESGETVIVWG